MTEIRQLNGFEVTVNDNTNVEIVFVNGDECKPTFQTRNVNETAAYLENLDYDEVADILTEGIAMFHKTGRLEQSIKTVIEKAIR